MISATLESTSRDDVAIRLLLPSALADRVLAYEDELERLRARLPDPAHARQCRTTELELPISNAIEAIRARLEAMHQTFRVSTVLDHLWKYRAKYGITRLPTRAVVQRVLVKHGLYAIAC